MTLARHYYIMIYTHYSEAHNMDIHIRTHAYIKHAYTHNLRSLGYEPADLTVHPPQNNRGWVHFFLYGCLVPPKIFPPKKVDFVGDIKR